MHTPKPTRQPIHGSFGSKIDVKKRGSLRRLIAFVGPAYLVSVGYMDPGNWATDIEGGARFGYMLIWVLLMSNIMAVVLQTLCARLGIVTGLDLAQGCRREYPRPLNVFLWLVAEIAIAATDLAEILGTVVGLNLLFLVRITAGPFLRPGRRWESAITTEAGKVADAITPVHIRHIGMALQHASGDGVIISSAVAEARGHRARITLLHVVDTPGTLMLEKEIWSLHGHPADAIIDAVKTAGIDMLVMGSHGHRGVADLVFGQTVSAVRHALDIPVLVVRSRGRERAQRG